MAIHTILKTSRSLFGKITIGETLDPHVRWMKINNEIEGQVFVEKDGKPGAIAASRYLYAFIIPAWHFSASHGLMLGLGAGIGATMLLALFPELSLTVVEIDPQVIQLARTYFPLISFYEKQNRLYIIQANANDYIHQCQQTFSFVLLDLFAGDENSQQNLHLLDEIYKIAPYFMANIITTEVMRPHVSDKFLWIRTTLALPTQKSNWALTNMQQFPSNLANFQLFPQSLQEKSAVKTANQYFQYILSQIKATCFYG